MRSSTSLFDDGDAAIELGVQRILASRRRANASGQDGEDIANIRAALGATRHNVVRANRPTRAAQE